MDQLLFLSWCILLNDDGYFDLVWEFWGSAGGLEDFEATLSFDMAKVKKTAAGTSTCCRETSSSCTNQIEPYPFGQDASAA